MATSNDSINFQFTAQGQQLATQALAGNTKLDFTKAVASTDNHFSDDAATIAALTTLGHVKQTATITEVETVTNDDTEVRIPVTFDKSQVGDDYQLLSVGLYCKPDDGDEVLYAVAGLANPILMHQSVAGSVYSIALYVLVGTAENVTIKVDPAGSITQADLTAILAEYVKSADIKTVAYTDKPNVFTQQQTLSAGAVDGAGHAYVTEDKVPKPNLDGLQPKGDYATHADVTKANQTTLNQAHTDGDNKYVSLTGNQTIAGQKTFSQDPVDKNGISYITNEQLAPNLIQENTDNWIDSKGVWNIPTQIQVVNGKTYQASVELQTAKDSAGSVFAWIDPVTMQSVSGYQANPVGVGTRGIATATFTANYTGTLTVAPGQLSSNTAWSYRHLCVTQTSTPVPYERAEANKHAQNAFDKTEDLLGTRNLLVNTKNPSASNLVRLSSSSASKSGALTFSNDGWTTIAGNGGESYYRFNDPRDSTMRYIPGATYTIFGKVESAQPFALELVNQISTVGPSSWHSYNNQVIQVKGTEQFFSFTFTVPENAVNYFVGLEGYAPNSTGTGDTNLPSGSSWSFKELVLWHSPVAGDYVPAPEDLEAYADNAVKVSANTLSGQMVKDNKNNTITVNGKTFKPFSDYSGTISVGDDFNNYGLTSGTWNFQGVKQTDIKNFPPVSGTFWGRLITSCGDSVMTKQIIFLHTGVTYIRYASGTVLSWLPWKQIATTDTVVADNHNGTINVNGTNITPLDKNAILSDIDTAKQAAINQAKIDLTSELTKRGYPTAIWTGTQAQYDAMASHDEHTEYRIFG